MLTDRKRPDTYANYLRTTPPERLSRPENRMLKKEQDWVAANPALAQQLDAMVGQDVYLKRTYKTMADSSYKAGTKLHVLERWVDRLHVLIEGRGTVIQVQPEWVTLTEPVKEKSA